MIYLEAGSGAANPVPPGIINAVKENISVPLAVGGGLKNRPGNIRCIQLQVQIW